MAIGDSVNQDVLIRVKGQTRDAQKSIRQFKRETENTASASRRFTGFITDHWATIAAGIKSAQGAIDFMRGSFEEFSKDMRLQAAAAGSSIEEMQLATQGLANEHELLRLSAAGLNSEFKLTQDELNEVSRFMLVLRQRGVEDMTRASERLSEVIRENNVDALEEWGIRIDETSGTLEAHEAILQRIREENRKFTDEQLALGGDEVQRNLALVEDAWRGIKVAVGEGLSLTVEWIDGIVGLREETERTARVFQHLQAVRARESVGEALAGAAIRRGDIREARGRAAQEALGLEATGGLVEQGVDPRVIEALGQVLLSGRSVAAELSSIEENTRATASSVARGGGGGRRRGPPVDVTRGADNVGVQTGAIGGPSGLGGAGAIEGVGGGAPRFDAVSGMDPGAFDFEQAAQAADAFIDFDEQLAIEKFAAVSDAFRSMGTIVSDVTVDMIEGQKSLAEGFEVMAGRIVHSIGVQLIQRGTAALAEAAILAFTPGGQGNAAGLAASGGVALATGTAIIAASNRLGFNDASGGGRDAGAGAAPSVSGLGRPTNVPDQNSGRPVTVVLGSEWHALSPTEQRHEWDRFQNALSEGDLGGENVAFS